MPFDMRRGSLWARHTLEHYLNWRRWFDWRTFLVSLPCTANCTRSDNPFVDPTNGT